MTRPSLGLFIAIGILLCCVAVAVVMLQRDRQRLQLPSDWPFPGMQLPIKAEIVSVEVDLYPNWRDNPHGWPGSHAQVIFDTPLAWEDVLQYMDREMARAELFRTGVVSGKVVGDQVLYNDVDPKLDVSVTLKPCPLPATVKRRLRATGFKRYLLKAHLMLSSDRNYFY
jgi:hypothetical protein